MRPLPLLAEAIGAEMALDTLFLDDGVHGSLFFAFSTTQTASQSDVRRASQST